MRGQRKISKLIAQFTGIPARYGSDFMFIPAGENTCIQWADDDSAALNRTWAYRLMEDYGFKLTNENVFILSILHELGHLATIGKFNVDVWNEEWAKKEKIGEDMTEENFFEKNQEYFLMPTEKAATDWAVEQYRVNYKDMKKWEHRFNCAINHYKKFANKNVFERF